MNLLEFFRRLYSGSEKYTYLWTLPGKITYKFSLNDLEGMAGKAAELAARKQNVYFGVGTHNTILEFNQRPHNEQITSITAVWVDIDIASTAHKAMNLPPDMQAAMDLLPQSLPPSIIVHSGYGIHAYWLLREEWEFETDVDRNLATNLLRRLQGFIRSNAERRGWKLDATSDLARVLRCPDSWNFKNPEQPVPCRVIESAEVSYNPEDFDILPEIDTQASNNSVERTEKFERRSTDGPARHMLSQCAFMRYCELNPDKINYNEWMAALSNIVRAKDGIDAAHKFSSLDAKRYNPQDTDAKINQCLLVMNPQGCSYIRDTVGFTGCPEGGCQGIKAPCSWSLAKIPQSLAIVRGIANISAETVFQTEVIEALAILKKQEPAEYGRFYDSCRGKLDLASLKAAISKRNKELVPAENQEYGAALRVGDRLGDVTTCKGVPDAPLDLALPTNFSFGENGVYYQTEVNDRPKYVRATGVPVIITERIYNLDSGLEKMEIAFKYYNMWRRVVQPKQNLFVARNITCLSNYGLNMTSETAKYLVRYLSELETTNMARIPLRYAVSRMGWRGNDFEHFLVPTDKEYRFDMEDGGEFAEAFVQRGTFEGWMSLAAEIRKWHVARFVLAASLAAPLLRVFNQRNFIIYFWGTSGGGKTAAMLFAMSAWGAPSNLTINFNMSMSGLEGRLALGSDLPTAINERQVAGGGREKQEGLERIVYMLEGGRGKQRATPNGIRKTLSWRTIGMATGEEPLSSESSVQGVKTRLLEFNVFPVLENELAKRVYRDAEQHCGWAGPFFVQCLIETIKTDFSGLQNSYANLQRAFTNRYTDYFEPHLDAVAIVCLADYLMSKWLFKLPEQQAEAEAMELAAGIIGNLPTKRQISDVERGWDFVQNWVAANKMRFDRENEPARATPCYGFYKGGYLCIFPDYLNSAMKEARLSPEKLLKEFADAGRIMSQLDEGKRRFRIRTRYNGANPRVIKIPII